MPGFAIVHPQEKPSTAHGVTLAVLHGQLAMGVVIATGPMLPDDYGNAFSVDVGDEVCYASAEQDPVPGFPDYRLIRHGKIRMKLPRISVPDSSTPEGGIVYPTETEVALWKLLDNIDKLPDDGNFYGIVRHIVIRRHDYLVNIPEYGIIRT